MERKEDREEIARSLFGILPPDADIKELRSMGESNKDRTYHLAPRLTLYVTPNGWYALKWDYPEGETPNIEKAAATLETLIQYGDLPPATTPRVYFEDSYPSAEAVLEDLKRWL